MNTSNVPRRVERVLESLGADPAFCHDVVGDLREEFAIREAWDGPKAARRWYYRESLRVAPHLLRSWWRGLGWRDVFRIGETVAWSWLSVIGLQGLAYAFVLRISRATGAPPPLILAFGFDSLWFVAMFAWNCLAGIAVGYLAASLDRRSPVPTALATAVVWTCLAALIWAASADLRYSWVIAANAVFVLSGMVGGGVLRATQEPVALPEA